MTKKPYTRGEIPEHLKWNLELLYPSADDWEHDFSNIDVLLNEFQKYRGRIGESPSALERAYMAGDKLERLLEKLSAYARHKSDEDTRNCKNLERVERIASRIAEIDGETAWFEPELLEIPDDKITCFINSPQLYFYKRSIIELLEKKPHTLTNKEERILGLASDIMEVPLEVFSLLNDADLIFPSIADGKGGRVQLTHGNYKNLLENKDRAVRRSAFNTVHKTYRKFRNTFSALLDSTVKINVFESKLRGFSSVLQAKLFEEKIPESVFTTCIESVKSHLPVAGEYYSLRKKMLGLDKIEMYDLACPLLDTPERIYSWEEACSIVCESLKPIGNEYVMTVTNGLKNERWVDALESIGKRSGAYSGGSYDSLPYILMNFSGTLDDVFTLAHELGHSMHSFFTNRAMKYHYSDYSIFIAEIASMVNELLLYEYLLEKTNNQEEMISLKLHLCDEIRTTVYRQAMFSEFEKIIYEKRENNLPLTSEGLCELYAEINQIYYPGVKKNSGIEIEWARIPHFHYGFYVFKYVTGFVSAFDIVSSLLNEGEHVKDKYIAFLSAGSSLDTMELLEKVGVNIGSSEIYIRFFENFSKNLRDIEKELKTN